MSYKSKHTGAQVDEAVSKVLNGEVGGGADWNAQEGEAGYIANKPNSLFEKGDAENSAVLKGGDNQVISEGGVALGKDNIVGLKGWYYSSIYKENDNTISVYLSNEQKVLTESSEALKTSSQKADDSLPNLLDILGEGTLVSLVNDSKYDDKFKIIGGSNGVVRLQTVDESNLPFSEIKGELIIEPEDYSIYCLSMPDKGLFDMGQCSSAFGYNNKVTNGKATAFGYNNHAYGKYSFVEGRDNKAGYGAHAEGRDNVASGYLSHVEGGYTLAEGAESHAEGWHTTAKGAHSHTEGTETTAEGNDSHAEGANTKTVGRASHVEGIRGTANGNYSHVEGSDSISTGIASHAEGYKTHAKGNYTHSEGQETSAEGKCSHAEGFKSQSKGEYSHAEGNDTKSEGINSHAEGYKSYSLGSHSHAEGNETKTEGSCAHAEGYKTQAMGKYSHAEGNNTISKNEAEHACGKYNLSNSDTRFSIGIGTTDTNRKNAFEVKQNGDIYIEGVDGRIQDKLNKLVNITYSELKSLRDNSKLITGQQYRITDYVTTTTQSNTQSAGHQFDVIVTADDVNVLNENARAIQHEGDTYFANSDLNAWEVKYCLDNANRFAWVDKNGKGVIYYMKDEFNNECPYDFKNIQFARWELSNPVGYRNDSDNWNDNWIQEESTPFDSLKTGFYGLDGSKKAFTYVYNEVKDEYGYYKYKVEYTISESPTYCYTFGKGTDYSMNGSNYGNVIKECKSSGSKIQLNNIVFLKNKCYNNSFGNSCSRNSFGYGCYNNSFGDECDSNSFGNGCDRNSFGYGCTSNSFGNSCYYNSFGYGCTSNSFGYGCTSNSFGNGCSSNSFGDGCYSNTFGNECDRNSFGYKCFNNSFGNGCSSNSFGESSSNLKSYYRYIIFDNGNRNINLNCTSTTSSSKYFQNVRIGLGVNNTTTTKTINDSNVGQTYQTIYKPTDSKDLTA